MRTLLLAMVVLSACGTKHVSRDEAQAACDHQTELGFWKGFESSVQKSGQDPKDPATHAQGEQGLVEARKTDAWKAQVSKCTDTFAEHATHEQTSCVIAAKTSADASACLK